MAAVLSSCLITGCATGGQEAEAQWRNYELAMRHGDFSSAIVAVNAICALDTADMSSLDTLMRLYYVSGNFVSTYKVGKRISDKRSLHKKFMAESALKLGKLQEAKAWMIDIEATDSVGLTISSKFKLATMHYNDREFEAALELLGKIVASDESFELRTRIAGDSAVQQDVVYYAASHNFAGFIFLQLEDYESANTHFEEALRVQPDFQLARNNIAEMHVRMAEQEEDRTEFPDPD